MAKTLSKSKRQYVHVNNGPAQRLARKTAGVKPAPMPDYIEPLLPTEASSPRGDKWLPENTTAIAFSVTSIMASRAFTPAAATIGAIA
jgi:hypothetical protein